MEFLNKSKTFFKITIGKLHLFYSFDQLIAVMTNTKIYTCKCEGLTQTSFNHLKNIVLYHNPNKLNAYLEDDLQTKFESFINSIDLLKIDTILATK